MVNDPKHDKQLPWQNRGRCMACRTKVAGCRRVKACLCGGRVRYR